MTYRSLGHRLLNRLLAGEYTAVRLATELQPFLRHVQRAGDSASDARARATAMALGKLSRGESAIPTVPLALALANFGVAVATWVEPDDNNPSCQRAG
jgi:hypothetical protein